MLSVKYACLVLFGLIYIESVHSSGFGKCPNYPSMPKFNLTKVIFLNSIFNYFQINLKNVITQIENFLPSSMIHFCAQNNCCFLILCFLYVKLYDFIQD